MKSAPAAVTAVISSPRREKSADRIDGAMRGSGIPIAYLDAPCLRNNNATDFAISSPQITNRPVLGVRGRGPGGSGCRKRQRGSMKLRMTIAPVCGGNVAEASPCLILTHCFYWLIMG